MQNIQSKALFFPSPESEQELLKFLELAKRTIRIAIYTFTNRIILKKLIELVENNPQLTIQIISDDVQATLKSSKDLLELLQQNSRIIVRVDNDKYSLMHNKYVILDEQYIGTGSFNWTQKAVRTNKENILLVNNKEMAKEYIDNFKSIWEECYEFGQMPPIKIKKTYQRKVQIDTNGQLVIQKKKIYKPRITKQKSQETQKAWYREMVQSVFLNIKHFGKELFSHIF